MARRLTAVSGVLVQCAVLAALVGMAVRTPLDLARLVPGELIGLLLTLLAVMAGAAAAVLAAVSAVLARSAQLSGLGFCLGAYSVVMLPLIGGPPNTSTHPAAGVALLFAWAVPAGGYLGVGLHRRCRGMGWVGGGIAVIGFAHLQSGVAAPSGSGPDLVFGALRLLGLLVVAAGVIVLGHRSQRALQQRRGELASRLASAEQMCARLADRAAHRDHEIRNGLSGLSGITELVRSSAPTRDRERLRSAVEDQLVRLEALLDVAGTATAATSSSSCSTWNPVGTRPSSTMTGSI